VLQIMFLAAAERGQIKPGCCALSLRLRARSCFMRRHFCGNKLSCKTNEFLPRPLIPRRIVV
jgi:hypothetical protein